MVSETTVLIGTSNWSGDYFVGGTTGAAVVIKQHGAKQSMIRQMKVHFDWNLHSSAFRTFSNVIGIVTMPTSSKNITIIVY